MRLTEKISRTGYFWIPGKKKQKVSGTLTISDGGHVELEIVGTLPESSNHIYELPRIIGQIEVDNYVTLNDCFYTFKSYGSSGISKSRIVANYAFLGVAFDNSKTLKFRDMYFTTDGISEWLRVSGIKEEHSDDISSATVTYNKQNPVNIFSSDLFEISIVFSYSLPGRPIFYQATISERPIFKISTKTAREFDFFSEICFRLTNLLYILTQHNLSISDVKVTSDDVLSEFNKEKKLSPFKLYYGSLPYSAEKTEISWHKIPFPYPRIKEKISDIIKKWMSSYHIFSPSLDLYFYYCQNSGISQESKFLALVQSLENFNRRTTNQTDIDSAAFDLIREAVLAGVSDQHKEWLAAKMKYMNEPSLRKRTKQMLDPITKVGYITPKTSKWLKSKIVDTRNYYTHYEPSLESSKANRDELWKITMFLHFAMTYHFAKYIGITDEEISVYVEQSYQIRQVLDLARKASGQA